MAIEKVKLFFEQYGKAGEIREFDESSATVELAAEAIGCRPERIAKTLSFMVDGQAILIVTSGDTKIDNQKYKAFFGTKAKMLTPDQVLAMVGHAVGGVCPFAIKEGVKVYLDQSMQRFDSLFPACGSSNSVVELTIKELEEFSNYSKWVDITKKIKE